MEHLLNLDIINLSLGGIILSLSVILLMTPIPHSERWQNFRSGRTTLAVAYIVLSVLMIASGVIESEDSNVSGMVTLVVSFYQALLYTRTCILFLRPRSLVNKLYKKLLTVFTLFSIILAASYAVSQTAFDLMFYAGLGAYALLMGFCTIDFIRVYNKTLLRLEHVYDEDMRYRVR